MDNLLPILLAFASMFLWGFSDLLTKLSLDKDSKWKVIFFGQLLGGLIIFVIALFRTDISLLLNDYSYLLVILALLNVLGMYTFYRSIELDGISIASPMVNSWVLLTVILGVIFYNEFVNAFQVFAIVLIIIGIFAISSKNGIHLKFNRFFVFPILSMILWAIFFFLLKIPNLIFGALIVTFSVKILTSLFSIPILVKEKVNLVVTRKKVFLMILLLGLFDCLGFLAFNYAIGLGKVSLVSAIASAVPLISVTLGVFVLKEVLTKKQKLGVFVTIVGLILVSI